MTVFDHMGFAAADVAVSKAFYDAALAPLGLKVLADFEAPGGIRVCGYGKDRPVYWFSSGGPKAQSTQHVAFSAQTRAEVDAFYAAALAAGGKDNGAPGLREHYAPGYYGAFVHDPDGHNIEAVTFAER